MVRGIEKDGVEGSVIVDRQEAKYANYQRAVIELES